MFCKLGTCQQTRIFFLALYSPHRPSLISQEDIAYVYKMCLRPAVVDTTPEVAAHWPLDYSAALIRSWNVEGIIHPSTHDLLWEILEKFKEKLLQSMNGIRRFKNAFFMHEIHGTKNVTRHHIDDMDQRQLQLSDMLEHFDMERMDTTNVGKDNKVVYMSAYMTEKMATYKLHQGTFRCHKAPDLFPGKIDRLLDDIQLLSQVYNRSRDQTGTACMVTDRFVQRSILSVLPNLYWDLKMMWLVGINYVLHNVKFTSGER
ncbi:hypothetical protein WOLCODRAFT_159308 [Wolfiporia cocos MD-104 SS10]|uniref:Uncharacterized protein n=1 Tax=Wolfiporia cocos (strain MD-104) TaxID=742152 RepID=A0A2H3JLA0_WOLCO|nr:hypothetical protein WOLCODRAFT_159308 [Wolfiporia cocos MD-104 SS10]